MIYALAITHPSLVISLANGYSFAMPMFLFYLCGIITYWAYLNHSIDSYFVEVKLSTKLTLLMLIKQFVCFHNLHNILNNYYLSKKNRVKRQLFKEIQLQLCIRGVITKRSHQLARQEQPTYKSD